MHNTIGDRCQFCDTENGYYGDATRGSPYDCVLGGKNQQQLPLRLLQQDLLHLLLD